METLTVILIIFVFGLGVWFGIKTNREREGSLSDAQHARTEKKEKNKKKILEEIERTDKITNDDVQDLLGVSDATATNYLSELEKEEKIEQIGEAGRGIFYQQKKRLSKPI